MHTPACLLTALADFLTFSLLSADNLLPLHIQGLGGAEAQIGRIMACYHAAAILCQAVAGAYLDRWPRKPVLLATTATLTAVAVAFAPNDRRGWHCYLLRFLQGTALALSGTLTLTIIADLAPPGRRAEAVGYRPSFAAGGAALALGSLAFWRSFREAERGRGSEAA